MVEFDIYIQREGEGGGWGGTGLNTPTSAPQGGWEIQINDNDVSKRYYPSLLPRLSLFKCVECEKIDLKYIEP